MINFTNLNKKLTSKKALSSPETYQIGNIELPIKRNARRKSIAVKQQNNQIFIEVPKSASKAALKSILEKHQAWLLAQIDKHKVLFNQGFKGCSGEYFKLFGYQYLCVWSEATISKTCSSEICHEQKRFTMIFKAGLSQEQKQQLACKQLLAVFKQEALDYLEPTIAYYAELMQLEFSSMTVKGYKARWGSCYSDGRIQFNWRLLQAPEWVIDYVIVHELAHLVHANHSKAFWDLVIQFYPKTKQAKKVLKKQGQPWIQFLQQG